MNNCFIDLYCAVKIPLGIFCFKNTVVKLLNFKRWLILMTKILNLMPGYYVVLVISIDVNDLNSAQEI